ncbi:MAG: hypothetical protein GY864_07425 [Desulfobacterales bacterium]|nr:hypothetical protein [Desulfobacterales bacterium]
MNLTTCVTPSGGFKYGVHRPKFKVKNLRKTDAVSSLGAFEDGSHFENYRNFPEGDVTESNADWIFEIPNAFPFRGTTYIAKPWADENAADPSAISLPEPPPVSLTSIMSEWFKENALSKKIDQAFSSLPEPLLLALAATSTDPQDLIRLAELCCEFVHEPGKSQPSGLKYKKDDKGHIRAVIKNHALFEVLVNNFHLPDLYKEVMVLKPGVQGGSEIVGESQETEKTSHVFEYLRRNSYIPWGHYASNMANDAIRYRIRDLTLFDITGLRHLYYQRTYIRMANQLGLPQPATRRVLSINELEDLRINIGDTLTKRSMDLSIEFDASLWGWNYGFDFSPSSYRLHASHQQIHQQFAMVPTQVHTEYSTPHGTLSDEKMPSFSCGDMVTDFIAAYRKKTGQYFFEDYLNAIRTNSRMDGNIDRESSLIIHEDDHVMVFVPKSQTSQWEVQLMTLSPVGNIFEADTIARHEIDRAILITMKILTALGARMITTIEYSKRVNLPESDQRLLYSFLPKLPESPGAFSEAQLRWINGHYPEDFAISCRLRLPQVLQSL